MADFDPATLPEGEFLNFVRGLQGGRVAPTAPPPDDLPPSVTPDTREALVQANNALNFTVADDFVSKAGQRMGIRPEAFLDISTGAPASVRFKMGLDENQLNQFKLLQRFYGVGNVDLSDDGRFIARNQPTPSGKKEDIMVDPVGFDVGDVEQMFSQILPMIAGAVGAKAGAGMAKSGIGKVIKGALGMAVAQEGFGAEQDAIVRGLGGDDINVSEIAKHRALMAVADAALGMAAAGGTKVAIKAANSLLGLPPVGLTVGGESATTLARDALQKSTGVKYPLTPGEASERGLILRGEAMMGGRPGSALAIDKMNAQKKVAEDELRRVFLGLPRTMTDDELRAAVPQADVVGQKGFQRLGTEALRLEGDVANAAQAVQRTGSAEAQALAGVDLANPRSMTEIGQAVRQRAVGDFETFNKEMGKRYDDFLSKPELTSKTVVGDDLAMAAEQVEKKLTPSEVRSGVEQRLDTFVPAKVRGYIDALKDLKGAKVSVNDLKQIRTEINNSIQEGIAIPGVDVKQLSTLKSAVDTGIKDALRKMPDKSLLPEWEALSKDYAKGKGRFDKVGVREMLVKEGESGSVGNTELAESIMGDSAAALDKYNALKEFMGASSPEFQLLQAGARQKILTGSIGDVSGYVEGGLLRSRLKGVRSEVAEELFGVNKAELTRIGIALSKAEGKLDTQELGQLAQSKTLTAAKIPELVKAEGTRADAYNNALIKAAAKGEGAERIKPSEFVRYASKMDPDEASKVMGVLSDQPELLQEIRQLAIEDVWAKAQSGLVGRQRVSGINLNEALGKTEVEKRTSRLIIGNDTVNQMEKLVEMLSTADKSQAAYNQGGKLAGQSDISRILMKPERKAIEEVAWRAFFATAYSGPFRKSITNLLMSQDSSRVLNAVIASTPFAESILQRYGPDTGHAIMQTLRDDIEPLQEKHAFIQGKIKDFDPSKLTPEEFSTWLKNNAKE